MKKVTLSAGRSTRRGEYGKRFWAMCGSNWNFYIRCIFFYKRPNFDINVFYSIFDANPICEVKVTIFESVKHRRFVHNDLAAKTLTN
jgi:hypothetical protein